MVLFFVELLLFALRKVTVMGRHISFLLVLDVLLPILQMRRLTWSQRTIPDAIGDAILLVRLPAINLVNARMSRVDLPRPRPGSILSLSRGGTKRKKTTHCQD